MHSVPVKIVLNANLNNATEKHAVVCMISAVLTSMYLMGSPPILHTHSRFGDLRLEMGFVVMGLWGVLGNAHKEQFIVSSMNDLLKMSLVRMPGRGGGVGWDKQWLHV